MDLYYLIYSSSPTKTLSDIELELLLSTARVENEKHHVTGMLVCVPDNYLQLIEGSEEAIKRLYKNILNDSRHSNVITLKEGHINERFFPDWAMGFDKDKYSINDYSNTFHLLDDEISKLLDILYHN